MTAPNPCPFLLVRKIRVTARGPARSPPSPEAGLRSWCPGTACGPVCLVNHGLPTRGQLVEILAFAEQEIVHGSSPGLQPSGGASLVKTNEGLPNTPNSVCKWVGCRRLWKAGMRWPPGAGGRQTKQKLLHPQDIRTGGRAPHGPALRPGCLHACARATKVPQSGSLAQQDLSSRNSRGWKPKSRCRQGWRSLRPVSGTCRWHSSPSCVPTWPFLYSQAPGSPCLIS